MIKKHSFIHSFIRNIAVLLICRPTCHMGINYKIVKFKTPLSVSKSVGLLPI